MKARDTLIELAGLDDDKMAGLSVAMGRPREFMRDTLQRKRRADLMATALDEMGYDLVARSRDDGFEIEIDPKE